MADSCGGPAVRRDRLYIDRYKNDALNALCSSVGLCDKRSMNVTYVTCDESFFSPSQLYTSLYHHVHSAYCKVSRPTSLFKFFCTDIFQIGPVVILGYMVIHPMAGTQPEVPRPQVSKIMLHIW
jgi:hypothetical protein